MCLLMAEGKSPIFLFPCVSKCKSEGRTDRVCYLHNASEPRRYNFFDDPPSPKFTCALTPLGVAKRVGIGIVYSFAVVRAQLVLQSIYLL
jgi:hypothetical protein